MSPPESKNIESERRRNVLKLGFAASASAAIVTAKTGHAQGAGDLSPSPRTRPWVVPLPVYKPKQPVPIEFFGTKPPRKYANVAGNECGRDPHQRWDEFPPKKFYDMRIKQVWHEFHPDLPKQDCWSYDGMVPGPTFHSRYGESILLRIHSDIPDDATGPGSPQFSTHLHNIHNPSESDGFAGNYYGGLTYGPTIASAGSWQDYHYPFAYAGYDQYRHLPGFENGDPREAIGTAWYHDHRMDFTAAHSYRGTAGFHLMFDHIDSGDETGTLYPQYAASALRLPSGDYDVPIILADKHFDGNGMLIYDQFAGEGFVGDKVTVNGKIQPYFKVARRKYRIRILSGGPARIYDLVLRYGTANQAFTYIANDGNLLPAPLTMSSVLLGTAERADIVIDFSKYPLGSKLYLVNRLEQEDGRKPKSGYLQPGHQILRFDVDREPPTPDVSQVPAKLRELPPIDLKEVVRTRRFQFKRSNGMWTVNDKLFDVTKPMVTVKRGTAEIWDFEGSGGWYHPIHVHMEEGRILSRNGVAPPPHERGRKDVYLLPDSSTVRIFIRFRDWTGKYLIHCHNTVHEDHAMMVRFDVIP
jgi:FtsP/CotA-like multicopper oxidase with cupredoxin domain